MTNPLFSRVGLAVIVAFSVTGCTNWLIRKECEKINWRQHGYDAAMSGRRLTGDTQVDRCRAAEFDLPEQELDVGFKEGMSNYCKPEIVFVTGKKGDFFNTDMCDPGQANFLRSRHAEGVKAYCAVDNGYDAGSSGKKYQNICPPAMEKPFLKEYKRGRKAYLNARIRTSEVTKAELDRKSESLSRQSEFLRGQLSLLPGARTLTRNVVRDGQTVTETYTEDPFASRRQMVQSDLNSATSQLAETDRQRELLSKQLSDDRMELATLD